ncbi:16S rRNA (uracil1498-N3)-methyltransferase [Thermosulfidibacter takaii ABI70S6]|uniref:Ribosomal RNA small subunit methyltransferase E n=1 Tax=Thermosulfidibacter takaii (strain DSM 17441 / JCM 13301 / NBRC 103674 / ABI70S6) TaxID=1298851 RepID=A0A0S3QU90_THET7|nr:RsmE family RNA methyltransferase [Thermosulfidibacter takaii]BAT71896.1 16S rRNA (uracil1498-N3)-methyltransferase [Thermosulfidibacter takaii ABI70S6]
MSVVRIFVDDELVPGKVIELSESELKHLKVRRKKQGDEIYLVNGRGVEAWGRLCQGNAVLVLDVKDISNRELPVKITLYQAILKSEKMDLVIQKATELGVARIVPVVTSRCVAKPDKKKVGRWRKIAVEALKQSGRAFLPEICEPVVLGELKFEHPVFVLWEKAGKPLEKIVLDFKIGKKVGIFVGPEGGIAEEDIEKLRSAGGQPASVGKTILRSETASLYSISVLRCFATLESF